MDTLTRIVFNYDPHGAIPMDDISSPCVPLIGDIVLISSVRHIIIERSFRFDHGMLEYVELKLEVAANNNI